MEGAGGGLHGFWSAASSLEFGSVLVVNLIIGAAAFVSSLSGFGYALVATPFLVLLLPPRTVVPIVMVSWLPLAALLVWEAHGRMEWRRIGRWGMGAVVGIPLGVYGLATTAPGPMRAVIGAITLLAALTLWLKPARPLRHEALAAPAAGLLSGIMGGATGMSGPPVILFGLNQGWKHPVLRANLIGYFAAKQLLVVLFLTGFGILNAGTLVLGMAALPGMALGYLGGIRLKDRVSYRHFRTLAFCLVGAGGLVALIRH